MSILIKGMEMPTTCRDCRLSTFTDFGSMPFCNITMDDICLNDWETKCCSNCPLVPVQPHGRLIDADALIGALARIVPWAIADPTSNAFLDGISAAYKAIQTAPTVIEAEEGET